MRAYTGVRWVSTTLLTQNKTKMFLMLLTGFKVKLRSLMSQNLNSDFLPIEQPCHPLQLWALLAGKAANSCCSGLQIEIHRNLYLPTGPVLPKTLVLMKIYWSTQEQQFLVLTKLWSFTGQTKCSNLLYFLALHTACCLWLLLQVFETGTCTSYLNVEQWLTAPLEEINLLAYRYIYRSFHFPLPINFV